MKSLAEYLAEYIDRETDDQRMDYAVAFNLSIYSIDDLKGWIEQGIEAYQSTENCIVAVCGGDCPNCNDGTALVKKDTILFDGVDDVEVCAYKCSKCGYIVYG